MKADFKPGDHVRARLWPELGTGTVLTATKGHKNIAATRVAKVEWTEAGQTSTHSFAALAHAEAPSDVGPKQDMRTS